MAKKKPSESSATDAGTESKNFIEEIIDEHNASGRYEGRVHTRFPPEPNGYLHIGHAKSICLNFDLAARYGGLCNLRFDDTNPSTEEEEYVESIKSDVRWLGFDWEDRLFFASDYFEQLHDYAVDLIERGKAYVDSQTDEEIAERRGNFYKPGQESPYRDRPVEENLELFRRMRAGEFDEGAHVLRAKIDMSSPNMNLRDPIMYRIRKASHHRTGDDWCVYPMYDWAHGLEDSIERITHSICTLEFENHRPLYDWFLEQLEVFRPQQIEFARLNLNYTVMSKRKLLLLVKDGHVSGWDDPRMPTISGLRRRGYTPESIRRFSRRVGVAKRDNTVDIALLEHTVREDLNERAPRVMAVLRPLKVVITNYPEGQIEELDAPLHPEKPELGTRKVPFGRELWVESDDFREDPPRKWHRLGPGREVRLRYACLLTCNEVIKDDAGEVVELRCTWDPESRGGTSPDGRKVRGTLHWVSTEQAVDAEVRLYDRLFLADNPLDLPDGGDFRDQLNPDSLETLRRCKVEPYLAKSAEPGSSWQFERLGYFCADNRDSSADAVVFNRTVSLRDSWAKIERKQQRPAKKKLAKDVGPPSPASADGSGGATEGGTKTVKIDDFAKLDIRVGVVREAELVEGADKLLRLVVDIGEPEPRQVFAGIRSAYQDPRALVGKRVAVLANLKPRKMRFGVSEGMVLTGGDDDATLGVVTFDGDLKPGDKVT
jgi:glutaminyl-tRNA synthetase